VIVGSIRAGVAVYESGPLIEHNVIRRTVGDGISADEARPTVVRNEISRNGGNGVSVDPHQGFPASLTLIGNRIVGNGLDGVFVGSKTVSQLNYPEFEPPILEGNSIDRNGDDGIDVENPATTVTRNHAWRNGDLGIEALSGTLGSANWAKHNGNPLQCVPAFLCSTKGKPKG
jgi:hypothetical protein